MDSDKKVVLLIHGMGFRDSNAPIEVNGQGIADRILGIFNETGCDNIHIIAHSRGGLDARYAISSLGMDKYVSTLTTISTPHNGSPTVEAGKFNDSNPDSPKVRYRSYAFVMSSPLSDIFLWLPNIVVGHYEGENDGLLAPEDVKWGEFQGVIRSNSTRGISHCDEVDMRRRKFTKRQGEHIGDILEVYSEILDACGER